MDITKIIVAVIALLTALADAFLIPYLRGKIDANGMEKLRVLVNTGVYAAEQLFTPDQWNEKKQYVQTFLASKGYDVNTTDIDAAIESAVLALHNAIEG